MPATSLERQRLRLETGDDPNSLPDAEVDALFDIAEAEYAARSRSVHYAFARLLRRQNLLAHARKQADYSANESSERLSQIANGLAQDVTRDAQALLDVLAAEQPAFGIGKGRRVPPRHKEQPHDDI